MAQEESSISINVFKAPFHKKKERQNKSKPVSESSAKSDDFSGQFRFNEPSQAPEFTPKPILKSNETSTSGSVSIWKKLKESRKSTGSNNVNIVKSANISKRVPQEKPSVSFDSNVDLVDITRNNHGEFGVVQTSKGNKKKKEIKFLSNEEHREKAKKFAKGAEKITSLFGNNPEKPHVSHRAVKPLVENVFSNKCFKDLDLHPYLVKNLEVTMGLTTMTTVQQKSIPFLLNGKDALIKSQTGSGKTLSFALPILNALQAVRPKINRSDGVLVLIIVPTRELAVQTYEVFVTLVKSYTWLVPGYLIGGERRKSEKARLRKGVSILIGTPGRIIDHMQHTQAFKLDKVQWLVLDEADRLLDMGYEMDVANIIKALTSSSGSLLKPGYLHPDQEEKKEQSEEKKRQTILLSATLTPGVERLAGLTLKDSVFVDACSETVESRVPIFDSSEGKTESLVLPESLIQKYIITPPKLRLVSLTAFILWQCKLTTNRKMLIFISTQDMVDYHTELFSTVFGAPDEDDSDDEEFSLASIGVEFFKLHGNMSQKERTEVFKTFRKTSSGVLICTDVAARGLDLPEVDWVVQYTGPTSVADYVHRVGRTARGGQSGSSIIFLTSTEVNFIAKLENSRIRVQEEDMDNCLSHLTDVTSGSKTMQEAASKLQTDFETIVSERTKLKDLACRAFSSWARFYASYPRNMRDSFSVKSIHLGHYAKSFALRDPPKVALSRAKKRNVDDPRFAKKRVREKREDKGQKPLRRKAPIVSEFDSGLEPITKRKKK